MQKRRHRVFDGMMAATILMSSWMLWDGSMGYLNERLSRNEPLIVSEQELVKEANRIKRGIARHDRHRITIGFNDFQDPHVRNDTFSYAENGEYHIFIERGNAYPSAIKHELYHVLSGDCDRAAALSPLALPLAYEFYFEPKAIYYSYTDKKINE